MNFFIGGRPQDPEEDRMRFELARLREQVERLILQAYFSREAEPVWAGAADPGIIH